jgi:large subunit ribosomal protein L19
MNTTIKVSSVDVDARKEIGFKAGDTVRVQQKIKEKDKFRLQAFEGIVLARKHGNEAGATFTVRKTASGVGVERIFPLYSPMIDSIEITKKANVRRAKLYYVRDKAAKEIRRKLKSEVVIKGRKSEILKETLQADTDEVIVDAVPETTTE